MGIIDQASKRLDALMRGGNDTPRPQSSPDAHRNGARGDSAVTKGHESVRFLPPRPRSEPPVDAVVISHPKVPGRPARLEIDLGLLERSGYLVPSMARSNIADEFRRIKRAVLGNVAGTPDRKPCGPLIMVASALPEEGKTFSAINLAMSLAMEVDTSVILVDADVVRPSILPRLGTQADLGFVDILQDSSITLDDVMLKTSIPNLSILPPGKANARSHELLASASMKDLASRLMQKYPGSLVIFDSPALLLTTQGGTLASLVGQVIMVVACSQTPRTALAQAFAAVEQCPVVTTVLNKCPPSTLLRRYGDYYAARPPKVF